MIRAISLLALTMFLGCVTHRQMTRKLESPDAMSLNVTQLIPDGTSTTDAIAIMESEGFECTVERDSKFNERRHWTEPGDAHESIDFIRCCRVDSAGFLMSRSWGVAILLDGDTSTGVLVSHFVDGP